MTKESGDLHPPRRHPPRRHRTTRPPAGHRHAQGPHTAAHNKMTVATVDPQKRPCEVPENARNLGCIGRLSLRSGTYFLKTIHVWPNATLKLNTKTGPVNVDVRTSVLTARFREATR